ncbi:MAG: DUF4907 domain-containing protein [Bacteroidetes bacterium]|nr:MAG: DUF4907 domain-containing protein [Bacteroidota bacterium]
MAGHLVFYSPESGNLPATRLPRGRTRNCPQGLDSLTVLLPVAMKYAIVALFLLFASSCNTSHTTATSSEWSARIIPGVGGGYGYEILKAGKVVILQPHIPSFEGNAGFTDSLVARKVSERVILKLEQGIMPPTLSREEVQELMK